MANLKMLFPNKADAATLSGGNWAASAPLTNLQNRIISKTAQSADALPASTKFNVDLAKIGNISGFVLVNHNLSLDATWRLRAYDDVARTVVVYDSGIVPVWPAVYETISLEYEDDNWWTGVPLEEDIEGFTWSLFDVFNGDSIASQYWTAEFFDELNTEGFISIGRLFVAQQWWETEVNVEYGATFGYQTTTGVFATPSGTEYFDRREPRRNTAFSYSAILDQEAFSRAVELERRAGIDGEIFVIQDSDDAINLLRRSFLGRLRELSPLEQAIFQRSRKTYDILELK